ncbi:hypothetical protein KKC91_05195 [bacterium]|nr:hypothetical protein [bacterium]
MQYPPNLIGFLKSLADTLIGKKPKPRIPKEEGTIWNPKDYIYYDLDKEI